MPTVEENIQQTVISLESGNLARMVWRFALIAVAIGLSIFFVVHEFRGLPMPQSMDQAQIGREILRGNGFATKFARPYAIGQFRDRGMDLKTAVWRDTYNAPIPPLLDAAALYIPIKEGWKLTITSQVYSGDRAIALMGVLFFLASLLVLFKIACELFDQRLAYLAVSLVLVSDMVWRYAISGLPQMFLLLLFNSTVYAILRALRARYIEEPHLLWVAAIGAGFGLMALTHALSLFIFLPVFLSAFLLFRPRWLAGVIMAAAFIAVYAPWLVRNAMVCGDFRGVAIISAMDGIVHTEAGHMRRMALDIPNVTISYYAENFRINLVGQINRLIEYLGWSCVAPIAFVSILHPFRRPVTAIFRRLLLGMWVFAVIGMAVTGMKEEKHALAANQFHLLFMPLFICYGMAYILVQWDRRIGLAFIVPRWSFHQNIHSFLRIVLIVCLFFISAIPLLARIFLDRFDSPYEWPPYAPPYVAIFGQWFSQDEIIGTDMPWAVAWYADRRSLWLPFEDADLTDLSDYQKLGGPVSALFFTPISGTENTLDDLVKGEYSHWTRYITRTVNRTKSPYPFAIPVASNDCVLYMDYDRRKPFTR